jgi:toxin-antitoxin system PIN domain toxin
MVLPDVNVLIYAFRGEAPRHALYKEWLSSVVNGDESYGYADLVLSSFVRIVTNPRAMAEPDSLDDALAFVGAIRDQPQAVRVTPGERHWEIFTALCRVSGAKGNLVADAYLAALAIESGSDWITTDGDFSRFPGLRLRRLF